MYDPFSAFLAMSCFGLVPAVISGLIGMAMGKPKGLAGVGFALGFFMPFVGLIIVAVLPPSPGGSPNNYNSPYYPPPAAPPAATWNRKGDLPRTLARRIGQNQLDQTEAKRRAQTFAWLDTPQEPPAGELPVARPVPVICCPHCQARVTNEGSLAGRLVACPSCSKTFQMP